MNPNDYTTLLKSAFTFLSENGPLQPATNYWRAFELAHIIQIGLQEGRCLDLGCGDGLIMEFLKGQMNLQDVSGVDIDPQETALAESRNIYSAVHTGSAADIPEDSNTFDFAFSNSVLEHIPNIEEVIGEVARVLKTGGRFYYTVPNHNFHRNLKGPLTPFGDLSQYNTMIDERCLHLRYWSIDEWRSLLSQYGLEITHHSYYLNQYNLQKWESIARYTSGILYQLSGEKKRPIELQRSFKIRSNEHSYSRSVFTKIIGDYLFKQPDDSGPDNQYACSMLIAEKQA